MEQPELDALRQEFRRYNSEDFLDATIAVCALSAAADGDVAPEELYSIDNLVLRDPALQDINAKQVQRKLRDYLRQLKKDRVMTERILSEKIHRMADDREMACALMRAAYLIIVSDHTVRSGEMAEFKWICGLLNLEPAQVWDELAHRFLVWEDKRNVMLVRAPASAVARIVNESVEGKWCVFVRLDDAKTAAAELYRQAIDYYKKMESSEFEQEMERRLADLPGLTVSDIPSLYD